MKVRARNNQRKILFIALLLVGLSLWALGANLNLLVIEKNDGRMPVLTNNGVRYSSTHFSYQDNSEVKLFFLTDIIDVGRYIVSIGDVFIFSGMFIMFTTNLGGVILLIKGKYGRKKNKTTYTSY